METADGTGSTELYQDTHRAAVYVFGCVHDTHIQNLLLNMSVFRGMSRLTFRGTFKTRLFIV